VKKLVLIPFSKQMNFLAFRQLGIVSNLTLAHIRARKPFSLYMNPEEVLSSFSIELPNPPAVAGLYKPVVIVGDLAYLSGHLPIRYDGSPILGEVGNGNTVEDGAAAARQAGLNMLATLKAELGSLDRIVRVVKILGLVNSPSGFSQHPQVINGCSELFKEVFGDHAGVGARSALGVSGLPAGVMVEIEGIFQVR
jgi:enamine deaminase RidA (YjgF/YER057c/UK114 family)